MQVKAAPPKPAEAPKKEEVKGPPDLYGPTLRSAATTTASLGGVLALGFVSPSAAFSSMFTKFGLASICGYQVHSAPFPHVAGKYILDEVCWHAAASVLQKCGTVYIPFHS